MPTIAETLMNTLAAKGVRRLLGVPGGATLDWLEAARGAGIEFVLTSHESAAAIMACVDARQSGRLGLCIGTFGPGAVNLASGVGCAYLDRAPVIALADEASDAMRGRVSQMIVDQQALYAPLTKWTGRLRAGCVRQAVEDAVCAAFSEPQGPAYIGLPAGLGAETANEQTYEAKPPVAPPAPDEKSLASLEEAIRGARRPLFAFGLTAARRGLGLWAQRAIENVAAPAVCTPMAKGLIPEWRSLFAGVLAHAASDIVAQTIAQADLVVAIGFDPVEINYENWLPAAPLWHVDVAPADLDRSLVDLAGEIVGDPEAVLRRLAAMAPAPENEWDINEIDSLRHAMFRVLRPAEGGAFGPRAALAVLRESLPEDAVFCCDVGAHLHLAGQQWRGPILMTNGWSSMGFAIPAALAAKLAQPEREVCALCGDGGFLMTAGEMATAARLGLPVLFVVFNDRALSLIELKQARKGQPRHGIETGARIGETGDCFLGVPVWSAAGEDSFRAAIQNARACGGPAIVEARIDPGEYEGLILRGK